MLYFGLWAVYDETQHVLLPMVSTMRYLAAACVCFCWFGPATKCCAETYRLPVTLADGQTVTHTRVLGLDGDLLSPELATKNLQGADYHEWCLRWNRLALYRADQEKIPPLTVRGGVSEQTSFATGVLGTNVFRRTLGRRRTRSSSRWQEQVWRIGGYGGGPVTIYNPFVAAGQYELGEQ